MDKAAPDNVLGRFREVVADPTNLLIERGPNSGFSFDNFVILHNGMQVPMDGPYSYYGVFNQLLIVNRGVHEPLEEFIFQQLLKRIGPKPMMLELGAYWGHYSMWLKSRRPNARVVLVEPEEVNLEAGRRNFAHNKLQGEFIRAFVGKGHFAVDDFFERMKVEKLDILHSDIQGFEVEMLTEAKINLGKHKIDYVFVSTHGQDIHANCTKIMKSHGYRVEASSDFEFESTSYDGFLFATSPKVKPLFDNLVPFRRCDIEKSTPEELMQQLNKMRRSCL
jgi:Methyltransferase FkbM domain